MNGICNHLHAYEKLQCAIYPPLYRISIMSLSFTAAQQVLVSVAKHLSVQGPCHMEQWRFYGGARGPWPQKFSWPLHWSPTFLDHFVLLAPQYHHFSRDVYWSFSRAYQWFIRRFLLERAYLYNKKGVSLRSKGHGLCNFPGGFASRPPVFSAPGFSGLESPLIWRLFRSSQPSHWILNQPHVSMQGLRRALLVKQMATAKLVGIIVNVPKTRRAT